MLLGLIRECKIISCIRELFILLNEANWNLFLNIFIFYVIDYFSLSKMSNFWKWVILMSHIHLQVISDEWKVSERFSMYG